MLTLKHKKNGGPHCFLRTMSRSGPRRISRHRHRITASPRYRFAALPLGIRRLVTSLEGRVIWRCWVSPLPAPLLPVKVAGSSVSVLSLINSPKIGRELLIMLSILPVTSGLGFSRTGTGFALHVSPLRKELSLLRLYLYVIGFL